MMLPRQGFRSTGLGRVLAHRLLTVLLLCGLIPGVIAPAKAASNPESNLKVALIYKLTKFVAWPAGVFSGSDQPLLICVLGDDPFDGALEAINGRTVANHPLAIRQSRTETEVQGCQAVFIARSESTQLPEHIRQLMQRPILTISDIDGFALHGGMVEIARRGKRFEFRINTAAAQRAGLQIAAPLLGLATIVEDVK